MSELAVESASLLHEAVRAPARRRPWRAAFPLLPAPSAPVSMLTRADGECPPSSAERRRSIVGWIASAVFHVNLLLILAATFSAPKGSVTSANVIESTFAAEEAVPGGLDGMAVELTPQPERIQSDRATSLAAVNAISEVVPPDVETDTLLEQTLGGGGAVAASGGEGNGEGQGKGDGKIGFFGTGAVGQRFVFIIDCSQSMEGERFARARRELLKALLSFTEEQEVYVFFFSDRAVPMFSPHPVSEPVKLDRVMRGKLRRWISGRKAFGGTIPDEALQKALAMKPDVIFFLSDGEFHPSARYVAKAANTAGTVIHTIAFGFRGGEPLLKGIAEDHKGRYRFVP